MRAQAVIASLVCVSLLATSAALAQPRPVAPVAPVAPPTAAPAEPAPPAVKSLSEALTGAAKLDYEAGKVLFRDGDYAGALVKFQSAYEKSNEPRLLWNFAACHKNLRHYAKTISSLTRYLAEGGQSLSDENRADANAIITALKPFVANVTVTVSEPGANVYIDNEIVGISPLKAPVVLDLGPHQFRAAKEGYRDFTRSETVSGASDLAVTATLEKDVHEGRVVVQAGAQDSIAIDGRVVGVGRWEGVLPSGGHQVRVTAPGMRQYQNEVVVQDNKVRALDITLERDVKPSAAVPTWIWIAGGALLVTGAAVGGYFLFKPADQQGAATPGTLNPQNPVQLPSWRWYSR